MTIAFRKSTAICTLCNPADVAGQGPRDAVLVVPDGEAAIVADDVAICLRCAQTIFEVWKDGAARYVHNEDGAMFGMTGTLYKPAGKQAR